MIAAYRHPDRAAGRHAMTRLIIALSAGVPAALTELRTLGRTLKRRATDILAYFDRPGTSNGPTEAMNGRLEHLRGSALGFRNLTHYIARSLLEAGGFRYNYTLIREEPLFVVRRPRRAPRSKTTPPRRSRVIHFSAFTHRRCSTRANGRAARSTTTDSELGFCI